MKILLQLFIAITFFAFTGCGDSSPTDVEVAETAIQKTELEAEALVASFDELDIKPRFGGCDEIEDPAELKSCSDKKLSAFINTNLNYPESASKRKLEGKVVVSFVVEPNGSLSDIEATTDFGGGLEEEAVRVIQLMNQQKMWWKPGWKNGKRQRVKLQLPINFKMS